MASATAASAAAISTSAGALLAGGAIGGMAGSLASQVVGNVTGNTNGINWRGVAQGGLAGAVGGAVSTLGSAAYTSGNVTSPLGQFALRSSAQVAGNYLVNRALYNQSFSWKGLAAGVAGSMAGSFASSYAGSVMQGLTTSAGQFAKDAFSSFAGGYTQNRARVWMHTGGVRSNEQLLTDAFGNALGNSMVGVHAQAAEKERVRQAMDMKAVNFLTAALELMDKPLGDTLWVSIKGTELGGVNCADTSSNGKFSNKTEQMQFIMDKTTGLKGMSPEAFVEMIKMPSNTGIAKAASLDYAFVMRELVLYHMAVEGDNAKFQLNDSLSQEALATDIQYANEMSGDSPENIYAELFLQKQSDRYIDLNNAMGSLRTLSDNLSSGMINMKQYKHSFNQSVLAPIDTVAPKGSYRMQNFGNVSGPSGNTAMGGSLHVTVKATIGDYLATGYMSKDGMYSADIYNTLPENVYFNSVGGEHKSLSGDTHNHESYYYFGEIFVDRAAVDQRNSIPGLVGGGV